MIMTLGGPPGSGTSTLAKILKVKLNLNYEYAGAIFRRTAKEMKLTLEEFGQYATEHPEIDKDLDKKMIEFARKDNYLLEGRMIGVLVARAKIPAYKIWLDAKPETRAHRLTIRDGFTYDEAINKMTKRDACDRKRYLDLYQVDPATSDVYDLKLMSDDISPEALAELIIQKLKP